MARRILSAAALVALLAVVMAALVQEALRRPIRGFDEPLWFMRSLVTPANVSNERYRYWAIDLPALNRWAYYLTLKATGLDKIPPDEKPCWSIGEEVAPDERYILFQTNPVWVRAKAPWFDNMAGWEEEHARYAPRSSIMAMRMVDLGVFAVCLLSLWFTARMVLKSNWLAALSVLPLVVSPIFARDLAFFVVSGDMFMAAGLAATLAAMTFFHLRGKGTSTWALVVVSICAGLATSGKQPGALAVAAFAAYLAWQSRGWQRVIKPVAAIALSMATFFAVNPVFIFAPGEWPWNVCMDMLERRAAVNRIHIANYGPVQATEIFKFFWWPFFPAGAYVLWASRKQAWFPPVGSWAIFLIGGMLLGMVEMKAATLRYVAPLEMGLFFPVALCMIALSRHHLACHGSLSPERPADRDAASG